MKKIFIAMLLLFIFQVVLFAQDGTGSDNVGFSIFDIFKYEHPVKKGEDEKKWSFNAGAGYMKKAGSTDTMDLNYSAGLKYDDNITNFRVNLLGFYGETKGVKDENRWTATGNFDHFLVYRLEFFSFTISDYNEITGLQHRNESGAGAKFIFIRNKYLLVDLSGAPVYHYEKFKDIESTEEWRWSIRGRGEIAPFDDNITLRYYAYYIPVFGDSDNYRLIQDVYLYIKIASAVGIKAGYRRDFNTYTPELLEANPLLKKTDETTYVQLSISI